MPSKPGKNKPTSKPKGSTSKPKGSTPSSQPATPVAAPRNNQPAEAAPGKLPSFLVSLKAIPAQSVPRAPEDFVPTDISVRRTTLRFIPKDLKAEALRAFEEVAQRGSDTVQKELPGADDTSGLGELIAQIKENDRALEAAEDLVAYLKERGQLIESAALKIIDDVIREVEHQAQKKPGVAKGYTQTLAYREAKAEKISEGRKRATKGNSKKDDS